MACAIPAALMPNAASTLVHVRSTDVGHHLAFAAAAAAAAAGDNTAASPPQLAGMGSCAAYAVATPPVGVAAMDDSPGVAAQLADQDRQQENHMTCLQPIVMSVSQLWATCCLSGQRLERMCEEARAKSTYAMAMLTQKCHLGTRPLREACQHACRCSHSIK